jgi:hypothetical protein
MGYQSTDGLSEKPRKVSIRIGPNAETLKLKFAENAGAGLDAYIEAELEPYKADWEKNRSEYVPTQSDFPGATLS